MELNQEQKELAEAMAGIVAGKTAAELAALMSDYPWRKERFAAAIFAELRTSVCCSEAAAVGNEVKA